MTPPAPPGEFPKDLPKRDPDSRVPVQGDGPYDLPPDHPAVRQYKGEIKPPGTIAWWEHVKVWEAYAKRFGRSQSAERIAERMGFSHAELVDLMGQAPTTWKPRRWKEMSPKNVDVHWFKRRPKNGGAWAARIKWTGHNGPGEIVVWTDCAKLSDAVRDPAFVATIEIVEDPEALPF